MAVVVVVVVGDVNVITVDVVGIATVVIVCILIRRSMVSQE